MGNADDGAVGHRRVLVEGALDLDAVDVLAPRMIMSLARSTMWTNPSSSMRATSPVRSHPRVKVRAVSSGRFQ